MNPSPRSLFFGIFPSIMLPMFIAVAEQTVIATALPAIAGSLGSAERVSWVAISYLVATTIAAPLYGTLGDVFGRRRMMFVGLGIYISGALLCAACVSMEMLALARVVQGLGGGGLMTCAQAMVGETIPARERGRYQGYLATVVVVAATTGPLAGGILTETLGWRSIFLVSAVFALGATALTFRLPRLRLIPRPWRLDSLGLVLFIVFVTSLLVALELARTPDHSRLLALPLLALSALSLAALVLWERRTAEPLIPLRLLGRPAIWRTNALALFHGATIVSLVTMLPIFMRLERGMTPYHTAILLVLLSIGIAIGSMATGMLMTRTGRTALFPSLGLSVATAAFLYLAAMKAIPVPQISLILGIVGVCLGTTMGVVQVTAQHTAGPGALGIAAGFVQLSRSIGASLGTALVASLMLSVLVSQSSLATHSFTALLASGPDALAGHGPVEQAAAKAAIGAAIRACFLLIAVFAATAALLAWINPIRRI